jgi:O-antigen/teichoic acid export membrane protein
VVESIFEVPSVTQGQKIIINTGATYLRSVISAVLALFSSRWVLAALGSSDYGLFNLVGSLIAFVGFLNAVFAASSTRHFAFEIGRADALEVNKWFNAAVSIHLILPVLLIVIGWPIGNYCIAHVLNIPHDRITVCEVIFGLSLLSAFFAMASVPFTAMFTAKQHIAELAAWAMLNSISLFVVAWVVVSVKGDRLLFYASSLVGISAVIQILQIMRACILFTECRLAWKYWFDRRRLKEMFSFASWTSIGAMGTMLRTQGSAVLLNLYFGTRVNAAYGIANQVSVQACTLSSAMIGAFSPEITSSEGRGERQRMVELAMRTCKMSTLLILLFAIPIMFEMKYLLSVWLRYPPPYTGEICVLILTSLIIDNLTIGHAVALNAYGRIAAYQSTLGTCQILTLPLAWVFLRLGCSPVSVGTAFVVTIIICSLGRVLWARYLVGMPVRQWVTQTVLPCTGVAALSVLAAWTPTAFMPPSLLRAVVSSGLSVAISMLLAWATVLDAKERGAVSQIRRRLWLKRSRAYSRFWATRRSI